ncbi:gamma-glutamyl-gamma-aminobutyrate hydrolase family protein [Pseudonocardia dioxanivorans]|uniref:gamma-glutamyl-gamma-aminobutyrate hydrolase family protein n=1 Tax=Pseudonocardia dioxanivorans TaxID=240495 RepID=UPI000CD25658|nr:gamma-glutamyl-gamma-aminobutyrate hydrolase family protein [Pseudonocardia dioxanivorans]
MEANERPPVVGLTAYRERARYWFWDHSATLLPDTYVEMVVAAGGAPVLLPPDPAAVGAVERLDALVITGGSDLDPARYGALPHEKTQPARPRRDATELAAVRAAVDRGIPVLGVCRGAQVLNVALGGTLHQHLPDLGATAHGARPPEFATVDVALDAGSTVGRLLGDRVTVRCLHHQAVDRLGEGLRVTARAADGVVEAVELGGHPFVVGVQWHPEQDGADLRLVRGLVEAAARARDRWEAPGHAVSGGAGA